MGKSAAQIEDDIQRQRWQLTRRLDALEDRVRDDVASVRDGVQERVDRATDKVHETAATTKGSDTPVAKHPFTLSAASFGAGAALGWISGGESDRRGRGHRRRSEKEGKRGGGFVSWAVNTTLSMIGGPAVGVAKSAVKSTADAIAEGMTSGSDEHAPAIQQAPAAYGDDGRAATRGDAPERVRAMARPAG